jgi:hypothetical protein
MVASALLTVLKAGQAEAIIRPDGYFYRVDYGPGVTPQVHFVLSGVCSCALGENCPATYLVENHLINGGEPTPEPPDGYYPVIPHTCPICGAITSFDLKLSSRHRGSGWRCTEGGAAHYWAAQGSSLQRKALGQSITCTCHAYHFPHRKGTGHCGQQEDLPTSQPTEPSSVSWLPLGILTA